MLLIRKIEKKRLINRKKKRINYIKYPVLVKGDFIIVWYISREKEKGIIRYQTTKGICMDIRYKKYNSTFLIRSLMKGVSVEQQFFYYSLNNIVIILKQNIVKYYRSNKLYYLRKKKIDIVGFFFKNIYGMGYGIYGCFNK